MRVTLIFFFTFLVTVVVSPAEETIKIGEVNPITGSIGQYGTTCHQGIKLAVDQANASGGVLGKKVELITEDNQSEPGQTATIVRKFVTRDKVVAIVGDLTSSATMEGGPIAQEAKIPMISPLATNPKVTQIGDYVFRVCFIDEFQGRVMARFAKQNLNATKAAVLTDVKQDYSVGLSGFFQDTFISDGQKIVIEQRYTSGDIDFRAQLSSIKAAHPDVVFVPGYYPEVSLILKQARQLGLTVPFIGCEAWDNPTLLQVAGSAANGCYFSNQFSADDPAPVVQQFGKQYSAVFGVKPDNFAALGYDAVRVLLDSIKRAGGTKNIRDAIAQTRNFAGVSGNITLDANRNASKPVVILAIKEGQIHYFQKVEPQ
jgi:branched-chain amino acid transport system substrate-binding protein